MAKHFKKINEKSMLLFSLIIGLFVSVFYLSTQKNETNNSLTFFKAGFKPNETYADGESGSNDCGSVGGGTGTRGELGQANYDHNSGKNIPILIPPTDTTPIQGS